MMKKILIIISLLSFTIVGINNISFAVFDLEDVLGELQETGDVDTSGLGGGGSRSSSDKEETEETNGDLIVDGNYKITIENFTDLDKNIIVGETGVLTIGSAVSIAGDITVNTGTLIIDSTADISGNIILNQADYIEIGEGVNIENLTGSSNILIIGDLVNINDLHLTVENDTLIQNAVNIKNIHLRTKNLNINSSSNVGTGVIYTYEDFDGALAGNFQGKLTVFQNFTTNETSNFEGNICILDQMSIGKTTNINSYTYKGLYGNLYPILSFDISDELSNSIKNISESIDKELVIEMKKIEYYNWKLSNTENSEEIETIEMKKEIVKSNFNNGLEKRFNKFAEHIDDNEKSKKLFENIKTTYELAIKWESMGQISQVCNNNNISFDMNSIYVEDTSIIFKNLDMEMKRYTVLTEQNVNTVLNLAGKLPLKRLAKVNNKIEIILPILAEKKNKKAVNIVLDIRDILRDIILYLK